MAILLVYGQFSVNVPKCTECTTSSVGQTVYGGPVFDGVRRGMHGGCTVYGRYARRDAQCTAGDSQGEYTAGVQPGRVYGRSAYGSVRVYSVRQVCVRQCIPRSRDRGIPRSRD